MIRTVYRSAAAACKVPRRYSCQILMKLEFSRQILKKYANIKFHKNPYHGSRVVLWGQTDRRIDGQTEVTKLILAFRSFANASKRGTE